MCCAIEASFAEFLVFLLAKPMCHLRLCVNSTVEFCASLLLVFHTPNDHMVTYNPVLKLVSLSVTRNTCHH